MFKKIFIIAICLFSPFIQAAKLQESRTITTILAENNNHAGFYTSEGLDMCIWGIMFIDLSNEAGRAHLSMALSAKLSGLKVIRMDYVVENEKCWLKGMHIK